MKKKRPWFRIMNKMKKNPDYFQIENRGDYADVYVYGEIGETTNWWTGETKGLSDEAFINLLKDVKGKNLNIHVNTPGGNVFVGIAMYNAVKQHDGYVTMYIEGLAGSIGSVFVCAGDKVVIGKGASLFTHNVMGRMQSFGSIEEIEKDFQDVKSALSNARESILDIYEDKTGKPRDYLETIMNGDHYFRGQEAVDLGIVDEIMDDKPSEQLKNSFKQILERQPENKQQIEAVMNRLFSVPDLPTPEPKNSTTLNQTILNKGNENMDPNDIVDVQNAADPLLQFKIAEEKRKLSIKNLFNESGLVELEMTCLLDTDCSVEKAQTELLNALKEKNKAAQNKTTDKPIVGHASITADQADKNIELTINAWTGRAFNKVDNENPMKNIGPIAIARNCLEMNGVNTNFMNAMEIIDRAFEVSNNGTVTGQPAADFPYLLMEVIDRIIGTEWQQTAAEYERICTRVPLTDFNPTQIYSFGLAQTLEEKGADGNYVTRKLSDAEHGTVQAKERGAIYTIERAWFYNDRLGGFLKQFTGIGSTAKRSINREFWRMLFSNPIFTDGKPVFDVSRGNLLAAGPMTADSWDKAQIAIGMQKAYSTAMTDEENDDYLDLGLNKVLTSLHERSTANSLNKATIVQADGKFEPGLTNGTFADENIIATARMTGKGSYYAAENSGVVLGTVKNDGAPIVAYKQDFKSDDPMVRVQCDFGLGFEHTKGMIHQPAAAAQTQSAPVKTK